MKIKVIELFAGYGSQHLALKRLKRDYPNFDYEVVAFCEIDKYAIKAYQALHGDTIPNLGDITKVDPANVPDCDLMTWSFPCTDISSAGLQKGLEEGSDTRSSLCWEAVRIFEAKRPKYLLMENVSALVSQKFLGSFNKLQSALQKFGYTNFPQLMNAKDYGVPQNRLRIFMVSVLDCQRAYYFSKPFKLEKRLKDVLEQNVDERYYLSDERVKGLLKSTEKEKIAGNGFAFTPLTGSEEYAHTVLTSGCNRKTDNFIAEPQINIIGQLSSSQNSRIIDIEGISPAVINGEKGGMPKIAEPQINIIGNLYDNNGQAGRIYDSNGISPTLDNIASGGNKSPKIVEPTIAAMRGRDKDNPNDRGKSTENYAQCLELKQDGTSNTITSVAKDNLLIEPQFHDADDIPFDDGKGGIIWAKYESEEYERLMNGYWEKEWEKYKQRGIQLTLGENEPTIIDATNDFFEDEKRTYTEYNPALRSSRSGLMTTEGIRIRRLTERELYKLMDLSEPDIDTLLAAPIPRTQHAKLAGNSIVVACLYHIFRNLFVDTEPAASTQTTLF